MSQPYLLLSIGRLDKTMPVNQRNNYFCHIYVFGLKERMITLPTILSSCLCTYVCKDLILRVGIGHG